jgi:hypothetical protein
MSTEVKIGRRTGAVFGAVSILASLIIWVLALLAAEESPTLGDLLGLAIVLGISSYTLGFVVGYSVTLGTLILREPYGLPKWMGPAYIIVGLLLFIVTLFAVMDKSRVGHLELLLVDVVRIFHNLP